MGEMLANQDHDREREAGNKDPNRHAAAAETAEDIEPRRMPWDDAAPAIVEVMVDSQCYPTEQRVPRIRRPLHQAALALFEHGGTKPYEIAQALESVYRFWARHASGDAALEDFEEDFDGDRRRAAKRVRHREELLRTLDPGDRCPMCGDSTVDYEDGDLICLDNCAVLLPRDNG
jgi:hypothetical protein